MLQQSCSGFEKHLCKWVDSTHSLSSSLSVEGSPVRADNYRLKLLHIAATLQLEHSEASEAAAALLATAQSIRATSSSLSPLQSSLRGALQSFVGEKTEAVRTGVDTLYGWTIGKGAKVAHKYIFKLACHKHSHCVLQDLDK